MFTTTIPQLFIIRSDYNIIIIVKTSYIPCQYELYRNIDNIDNIVLILLYPAGVNTQVLVCA
jgi:hypothetical protein